MGDTKRKVEEILGLTQARRERKTPLKDLGIREKAHDPYIRALYEQPPVDPTVTTNQDVIVQPGTPGVDEPMATPPADEAPPEVPDELKEPEDEDEELRRALFNTLSELIDLGRVERDEVSIRKYSEEHEEELGELLEVLDEVVDMLVVSADITREVQTFEPESTPGQKGAGELKPGVGGQVPVGSTVSTVIASDQTPTKGQPIKDAVDAILAGKDVNEVLSEAEESEATVTFDMKTELGKTDADYKALVPKINTLAKKYGGRFDGSLATFPAWAKDVSGFAGEARKLLRGEGFARSKVVIREQAEPSDGSEYAKSTRDTYSVRQGKVEKIVSELKKHVGATPVKGPRNVRDAIELYWGPRADYELRSEGPYSYDSEAQWSWDDEVAFLASEVDDHTINEVLRLLTTGSSESVTEQMDITRAAVAVELRFSKKEEAGAAKGALLQYKGVDGVEEIADGGLVVFTTDTDVDEARNRVETIMRNARIPLESVQIEHYEPLWEQDQDQEERELEKFSDLVRWAVARMLIHGDTEPRVTRRLVGAGLSQGEADEVVVGAVQSIENMTRPDEIASAKSELQDQPEDPPVQEQISTSDRVPYVREVPMPMARGQSGADLEAEEGEYPKHFLVRGPDDTEWEKVRIGSAEHEKFFREKCEEAGIEFKELQGSTEEQAEPELDTDREPGEERYLQPFYGPDDEEMPPEEEPSPESVIWRMDIPEDPDEFDRLAEVLNAAKEQGLIMSWTRVTGEEEEIPPEEFEEPEGEPLDLRDADIDVAVPAIEQIEPPGVELEPGDKEIPELPPDEPLEPEEEPEKEYIAVEFAPETEVEEREGFPDFISAETGDPDTGEGGILVGGWEPVGDEEEVPPEDDELAAPEEEPIPPEGEMEPLGEGAKLMTLEPQGIYFEIRCDTMKEVERFLAVARRVRGVDEVRLDRGDKTVSGEMRTSDEKRAEDIAHRMAAQADLELTETAVNEQDPQYQRYLQRQKELRHGIKHAAGKGPPVRVRPSVWKAAEKKPVGPELPPDVQQLVKDYRAAMMSGDTDLAQRIRGELEFELEMLGVDVKTVLGEGGNPCPTPGRRIRSKGRGRGLARGRGRGPRGVPVSTKEQRSDPTETRRGQGDLVERREWRGATPRVDRVAIRRGDDPQTVLLKVEGPKVIERGGRTQNVDPTGYVAFVLEEWLDRKTETRGTVMKQVNPVTVELRAPSAEAMTAVIGGVQAAMDNMYADVTGYGVTEPLEKPPGILRRVGRRVGRFGFEDERQNDRRDRG